MSAIVKQVVTRNYLTHFFNAMCVDKHNAYKDEKEWRCAIFGPDTGNHPIRLNERHRRFIELHFDPIPFINEIWISPHGNGDLIDNVVKYYIENNKLAKDCKIVRSDIPYRTSLY